MKIPGLIKQKDYEKIVFVLRRHPITFIPILALFLVLILVPIGLYFLITNIYPGILANEALYVSVVLFSSAYTLSILLLFYTQFIEFYLDLWIVTNDRIVDIEQLNLFARTVSELDLFRIQDVTTSVKGIFPTVFNYGDVIIKTASGNKNIVFYDVYHPNLVRESLIKLSDEDRKYHYQIEKREEMGNVPTSSDKREIV